MKQKATEIAIIIIIILLIIIIIIIAITFKSNKNLHYHIIKDLRYIIHSVHLLKVNGLKECLGHDLSWRSKTTIKESDTLEHQPRSGQYLTHADSCFTRVVAAKDSCFGLVTGSSA